MQNNGRNSFEPSQLLSADENLIVRKLLSPNTEVNHNFKVENL